MVTLTIPDAGIYCCNYKWFSAPSLWGDIHTSYVCSLRLSWLLNCPWQGRLKQQAEQR